MRRKWLKGIGIALSIPVLLFLLLIILLYIPPIQNLLRREVISIASESTGMHIQVQRIDLRFPLNLLVKGVEAVQEADTLLTLDKLNVSVQLFPLFKGKVELNDLTLERVMLNSASLIEGMSVQGKAELLSLKSHGIDFSNEAALINHIHLKDAHFLLCLNDTTTIAPNDSVESALNWRVKLEKLEVENSSLGVQMPLDTLFLSTHLSGVSVKNVAVDLGKQYYGLDQLLVNNSSVRLDMGNASPLSGFDPSHIALSGIEIHLDSVMSSGRDMKAVVQQVSMTERSGLHIASLNGRLSTDSTFISLPELRLLTSYSDVRLKMLMPWDFPNTKTEKVEMSLSARLGKGDLFPFLSTLSPEIKEKLPSQSLSMQVKAEGNAMKLQLSRLLVELPEAFSINGLGGMEQIADSLNRSGSMELNMQTGNLDFLASMINAPGDSLIVIPADMSLGAALEMKGEQYKAMLQAREQTGRLDLDVDFHRLTEEYKVALRIDSLQIDHFLPQDSIGMLAVRADLSGKGIDPLSPNSSAVASLSLNELQYGSYQLSGIDLSAELKNLMASAKLNSRNNLLTASAEATYHLNKPYTEATAILDVEDVDLHRLGVIDQPLSKPVSLKLNAKSEKDSIRMTLASGDLRANFRARTSLEQLIGESTSFLDLLLKQVEEKKLNHADLRRALPSAALTVRAGNNNTLADILALNRIKYNDLNVGFVATPKIGINGRAAIHALRMDTLLLDTLFFATHQDTSRLRLRSGVTNGVQNKQYTFKALVTGEVRTDDAELLLEFDNEKGEKGILFGVNVRPQENGMAFSFIPEEPIVAFRKFRFEEHNHVFLRDDLRLLADVEMLDSAGMGLLVHSIPDSLNLQNLDIEIRRIELAEISKVLPYLPDVSGLFSLEANYQQSTNAMQLSTEVVVKEFSYQRTRIGNLGVGATWLPDGNTQYVDAYLTNEGQEILGVNGSYNVRSDEVGIDVALQHFPLYFTNALFPMEVLELSGDIDGALSVTGLASAPKVDGELEMHEVGVESYTYGVHFQLDERPVQIKNSRLLFNQYAIYSKAGIENPFTVNGFVDFANLNAAYADLSLLARNYPLLNARRSKISELYGRVFVDLNSTLKGPLDKLVMRGNLNLLPSTNVTYVMKDSPLNVQDRLGDLVEFTSFAADTIPQPDEEAVLRSWGGLDMMLTINIDPAVKVGVDLSEDRSSYITLEGGGALAFSYTPQGDMSLTGRYTFSGGVIKYALPVIPLKEFAIKNGSYVDWVGNPMDPNLNLLATERMRASVPGDNGTRMVTFDVSIVIKNKLEDLDLSFNLEAPEDMEIQQELAAMDAEERGKQAVALMVTGMYIARGGSGTSGGLDMGSAFNSLLQSQVNNLAGSALKTVNISFGMDNYDDGSGSTRTDYNFRYAQRFFNDRVQVVVGGRVSTGGDDVNRDESFIDNISLEYRLDSSSTRYLRLFHNKNYESLLEGEVVETGIGLVLRKKVNRLGELFIFRKKKD